MIYEGTREVHKLMQADYVLGYRVDKATRCELHSYVQSPSVADTESALPTALDAASH